MDGRLRDGQGLRVPLLAFDPYRFPEVARTQLRDLLERWVDFRLVALQGLIADGERAGAAFLARRGTAVPQL